MDNDSPEQIQKEMMELLIKAARRCMYDLKHAADDINDPYIRDMIRERARMWETIFVPDNGLKNYRAELHKEIFDLECKVDRLERLLVKHGIEDPESLPF